eukprot:UN09769
MHVLGSKSANPCGTCWVYLEKIKVPVENLLGEENKGFKVIMYNFNHERWYIACGSVAMARVVVGQTLKWCFQRKDR